MKSHILELLRDTLYRPLNETELLEAFQIDPAQSAQFLCVLDELEQEGKIYKTRKKKYILPEKGGLVAGTVSRTKKGYGFVIPEKEKVGDIFVPASMMHGAMHGDFVMALVLSDQVQPGGAGSREGEIKKILKRKSNQFAGTFQGRRNQSFVTDTGAGEDIFIPKKYVGKARKGDKVLVKIISWPKEGKPAEGKILEVLGPKEDPKANLNALIWEHHLPASFPSKVQKEAEEVAQEIPKEEIRRREDLREKTIVTIDGITAKDLDDAVSVQMLSNGNYLLGVHIADVSHYVKEGSRLDREARKRGTSVYFINRVIPMLPERLSNGVCSLNPDTDRLTLSCEMEIDPQGNVVSHRIFESVIQSKERLVYTDVSDILEKEDPELIRRYRDIYQDLLRMDALAGILRKKRMEKGSIDFDFDEAFITVDENDVPVHVGLAERRRANRLIEEFMLITNQTVSEHFFWLGVPFLYRVHESPDPEKIEELKAFIWNFGYRIKGSGEHIHSGALNDILRQVKGKPEENLIQTLILRAMKKAVYHPSAQGHFGLGFRYYSHFTSPIRRYPDLLIHRIIKMVLNKEWTAEAESTYQSITEQVAELSSEAERNAEKMEREAEKLKLTEYMSYHIGENYDGIISGIVSSGFFVQIEKTIEGFVSLSTLYDDYYQYDRKQYRLIGERTGKRYCLGDSVQIKVVSVSLSAREIHFELQEPRLSQQGKRK